MIRNLVSTFALLTLITSAQAADQVVSDLGDNGGANQLRAKIAAAQSSGGGTLTFSVGTATIVLTSGVLPAITGNVTIEGGNVIALSGNNASPLFQVNSGGTLTLSNLTVTHGFNANGDGGAIRNGSAAGNGGTLNINNCKFLANEAASAFSGGAIVSYGPLNITNSEFGANKAGNGGAIYPRFGPAVTTINGCNFHDNVTTSTTNGWGGALLLWDSAPVTIANSKIVSNTARHGGGIYVFARSNLTMRDSDVTTNTADNGTMGDNYGGGILNNGVISLTNVIVNGNQVVEANNFNDARGGGGIANLAGATATITRGAINNNRGREGGGILNRGLLTITDVTMDGNRAGEGGAILNNPAASEMLTITGSTLSGNVLSFSEFHITTPRGAAILNEMGKVQMTNATISGNSGQTAFTDSDGNVTLVNVTMANNSNGAIGSDHGPNSSVVSVKNTLVASNGSSNCGPILFNSFTGQFNLATDSTCTWSGTSNQVVANANLGPLAYNGGLTQTHLPLAGSAAIDNGTGNGAPARDQRGYVRAGAAPDVGAAEFGGTIPVTLANISTRLLVQTGDNVLIGGFIITGTQQKKVILRAIGPSLNLPGKLADPTLELYQGQTLLEANDNWVDSPNKQAIIDSTIPPSNNLESAIVKSLAPGPYTAVVRGANNGTGIGVVEAYDLDRTVDSKLANISTRGPVQTGDNVLFGGFIVLGPDSQKVIIRALGPSVPVPGTLADPTLELHDANGGTLETNDNWVDSPNKQAIIDSTIPPTNNLESAIVRTLAPANYTAIVRGVNNTTGIAVVEVYALN